ncbi:hypothetical protein, partial [Demequina muriae]
RTKSVPKLMPSALLLTFALSGCASVPSGDVKCPQLPPVPASLMQPPTTEAKVRQTLFEPQQTPTPKSVGSKHS